MVEHSYIGGVNQSLPVKDQGNIWVYGEQLLYSDYSGVTRVITGARVQITNRKAGEIFIKNGRLYWVIGDDITNYEFALSNESSFSY
jgi:hypothetical protein